MPHANRKTIAWRETQASLGPLEGGGGGGGGACAMSRRALSGHSPPSPADWPGGNGDIGWRSGGARTEEPAAVALASEPPALPQTATWMLSFS